MSVSIRVSSVALGAVLSVFAGAPSFAEGGLAPAVEFPVETKVVVAATSALFASLETTSTPPKKSVPVIEMPRLEQKISLEATPGPLTQHGPLRHLTGYRIDWYPTERLLGSVDFMGTWAGNRNLVCGYLVWDVSDSDAPALDQVIANFIDMDDLSRQAPSVIHARLLEANCAYGAIEANFGYFEPS
ncbi:MAG: hypothetical protein OIF48_11880 [Silicimonas sp.]|nr:hypothetical protein [Silicimonas sp.]